MSPGRGGGLDTKTDRLIDRQSQCDSDSDVEAGSNTSTVAVRVVGGDKRGNFESERVKMVASPTGHGPENECAGEDQQQL
jgi:hypothetical protein